MQKPDFKELKNIIKAIKETDTVFDGIFSDRDKQIRAIRDICTKIGAEYAKEALSDFSVDELKNAKAGIRVSALIDAGYTDLGRIAKASDLELSAVEGIGDKQISSVRSIVAEFANSLASKYSVRLEYDENGPSVTDNSLLITQLYRFSKCEEIRKDAAEPAKNLKNFCAGIEHDRFVKGGFGWLVAGNELKQHTVKIAGDIFAFFGGAFFERLLNLIDLYHEADSVSDKEAMEAFKLNGADFYALLEAIDSTRAARSFVYDSIPASLAKEVDETVLDLSRFIGNLRAYQSFGTKYIIHQKYVLLGDEMGLGKTVQAIAAMAHIAAQNDGICHFLVICPASVLINWAREIGKFSDLEAYILHGTLIDDAFTVWHDKGGVAITNYESLGKIVGKIDEKMTLSMLTVDEAHYMKNPDAQRTKYIKRLDNESEHILMMTGTPLENRVDEMCNLVEFIRPDMVAKVRGMAHISHLAQFREELAPLYLRRTRKQVLEELPPIEEKTEWCDMTVEDRSAYISAVSERNLTKMRRISFLQDDMNTSSKAVRLLELCEEAVSEGRKVVVYSFFRETISKISAYLGEKCMGVICGDTEIAGRQGILDRFANADLGSVLVCQVQAGGIGLNIQAASIVIFCEPQIKPSLTWQAFSRVYRMGQVRNVIVYHLLCPQTVDEEMLMILDEKQLEFKNFADESVVADAFDNIMDKDWIKKVIDGQNQKYLPMVI